MLLSVCAPPIHCLSPHPVSWGPQLTLYWKEKSLCSLSFFMQLHEPFPALCAYGPFFSSPSMCMGFLGPSKASPTTYPLGTPFLLVKDFISLHIPFSFEILSHPLHCSHFSHFIETETSFDSSSTTESTFHIATSLSAQCLLSLHSYFMVCFFR